MIIISSAIICVPPKFAGMPVDYDCVRSFN
jgi:hypothetical protein